MNKTIKKILFLESSDPKKHENFNESTALLMRVSVALTMLFAHGWGQMMNFSNIAPNFVDPLGLGPTLTLALVVGSEVFGALFLALGLFTRWSSFSLLFIMLVGAFVVHLNDPFTDKELPVVYALIFFYFTVVGGGKYSLDALLKKKL